MKLREMTINQRGRVRAITTRNKSYRHKLLRMGLVKGAELRLVRYAPLGDPVVIEISGFRLILRKKEADVLDIEVFSQT